MDLPLISHPDVENSSNEYSAEQLTDAGDLRLRAHNETVADRATRLFGPADERQRYVQAAAALHDFGKATPQFQAHVRPDETYDGPEREKAHARLGAMATWYVLGLLDAPPRDRLAATLAIARHHQALPDAAQYTVETLARTFEEPDEVVEAQLNGIDSSWPAAATELLRLADSTDAKWADFFKWAQSGAFAAELREHSAREQLAGVTPSSSKLPQKLYDRTLHYWSAITLADKTHAMAIPEEQVFDLESLDRETLEEYIADLREEPPENDLEATLNDERERARRQAIRGVHEWLTVGDSQIATLTLPTGLGKTFTGLSAAFETRNILAEQADTQTESTRPIVYALPYTSIIEQTRAIFENPDLWGADPEKSALTVHHYLSETIVSHDEHANTDVDATDAEEMERLLGESWRDGTILTTFVQLFESLSGPSNRQGLKLPTLDSGLVILDEPQALPKDWWDGIERLLELLTEEYGTRVIAMTATQPSLVRELETTSLLTAGADHNVAACTQCQQGPTYPTSLPPVAKGTYFEEAERVRYTIDETALTHQLSADDQFIDYDSAADRLLNSVASDGSTLAICNTIESSRVLAEAVCDRQRPTHLGPVIQDVLTRYEVDAIDGDTHASDIVDRVLDGVGISFPVTDQVQDGDTTDSWTHPPDVGPLVLTLNSRYRPFDRQVLIELADQLSTSPVPFILVSTQAIEAGVDISFKTVFRDIAPLDSIVQAAGRCNRSYEWGRNGGRVVVWTLAPPSDESSEPPAHWVYERGATDAGIPGHLRLISDVLADIPNPSDVPDVTLSRDAVDAYFNALQPKLKPSTEIRDHIDEAKSRWLARQSIIGGYETVDVLVAITDSEIQKINQMTERFFEGRPEAYDDLEAAANIRVSLPADIIEDAPQISRVDGKQRNADGVQVFRYTGEDSLKYALNEGGLQADDSSIAGRFTI